MDFKQLQSFAAVVKYQSFTRAADKLFLSQPTVSSHVSQLEEELGRRLILRTTKHIELTPKGSEVYEYAVRILELRDRMVESCAEEPHKIIHLGASTIPSAYILPNLLSEFGALWPDTYFSIHQSDSQGVVDGMNEGLFDVGMVGMAVEDERMECVPFCRDRMVLITPVNDHFLALKQANASLAELLKEPIIMREQGSGSKKTADRFLDSLGVSDSSLNIIARINDQEAIKNMVASGLGISIISEMAVRNFLMEKRILGFPLSGQASGRDLYLIYHKNYILQPHILRFLEFLKQKYR